MQNARHIWLVLVVVLGASGCWRDPAEVAAEYEDAWAANHPDDAALAEVSDTADDVTVDVAGTDAVDAPDVPDVADALDAPDAPDVPDVQDPCAGVSCTPKNGCQKASCDPLTGKCVGKFLPDTVKCDDGSKCTAYDVCNQGECMGTPVTCDDKNGCTTDSCDPNSGCVFLPNSATCSDGTVCTTGDACKGGVCVATPIVCDDGNVCTNNNCDAVSGCVFPPNTATCSDGDACSDGDICANTVCGGIAVDCNDGNTCTADACDKLVGCTHSNLPGTCDDGNPCTLPDACVGGKCVGGAYAFGLFAKQDPTSADALGGGATSGGKTWLVGQSAPVGNANDDFAIWTLNPDGSIGTTRSIATAASDGGDLVVPASGGVWAIGHQAVVPPTTTGIPAFAWFGDDQKSGVFAFSGTDTSWTIRGQANLGAQWLLAGSRQPLGQPTHGWIGVATPKPGASPSVVLTSEWLSDQTANTEIDALVARPDGTFLGIGNVDSAEGNDLWIVQVAATGDVVQDVSVHLGTGYRVVDSAIPTADGGALVSLMHVNPTPSTVEILRLNADLSVRWRHTVSADLWVDAYLVAAKSGAFVVGETMTTGLSNTRPAVVRLNDEGLVVWSYVSDPSLTGRWLRTGAEQADGRFVAYGYESNGPDYDVIEVALDPWGSPTCTPNGPCSSLLNTNTDDGNPCTLDQCNPVKGIVHTPVPDGTWCDDGVPCTIGDACSSATCIGGPRLFTKNYSGRTLENLIPVTQGGFLECGATSTGAYVTWVDAAGKQLADDVTSAMIGHGCVQDVDDAIWQVGKGASGAVVRKFDLGTGVVAFTNSMGGTAFTRVVANPSGGAVALGSNQPQPRVTRLNADGSKGWEWLGTGVGDADSANDAVFLADGALFVVGEKHASAGNPVPFAVLLDSSGVPLWSTTFTVSIGRLVGAGLDPSSTPIAVGGQGQGGPGSGAWIVAIDPLTGNVKKNLTPPSPQDTIWHAVAWFPSAAGATQHTGFLVGSASSQAVFARVNSDTYAAKPEALGLGSQGAAAAYRAVVLDPSGDVLIGGNTTQAQLTRIDAWYHQTCTSAGKCLGVFPAQCDDQNPCTSDDCDGTLGCKYTAGPPNQPCPGGMCQGGVCK